MPRLMIFRLLFGLAIAFLPQRGVATQGGSALIPAATSCSGPGTGSSTPAASGGIYGISDAASASPRPPTSPVLRPIADIPLPGGATRFDYQSFDPTSGRLWIAHMAAGQVVVFDTKTNRVVGTVAGLPGITGVLVVPALHRVYAAVTGDHLVAVIDTTTLKVIARLGTIPFPDGLDYVPASGGVFVSDESGGGELVIDARANRVVTTIAIGGEAGNTHVDPLSGCVIVAVQTHDQLVFLDPTADRVVARFNLDAGCQGPHGFVLDPPRRLAFVACEDNARLLVVDLRTGRVLATYAVGDGPDVLAFDPGWRRLYVAAESGVLSIFDERGMTLQPSGTLTLPHAHTVAVDPATHRVYLPLENVGGRPVLRVLAPVMTPEATPRS